MAGETKGDNKLYQMIMVIVTTIVAPVTVYFITHPASNTSGTTTAPTSTLSAPVDGAAVTATAAQPVVSPTPALPAATPVQAQPAAQPTATTGASVQPWIQNPQGILPADAVGDVNGITVSVIKEKVQVKDGAASIQLRVRNQSGVAQTFRYQVQSITVQDANRRSLGVLLGEKRSACSKKDLSAERKIELAPDQEIIFQSVGTGKDVNWCASGESFLLPLYQAPTREAAEGVVILFNGFGPFQGFGFQIDL